MLNASKLNNHWKAENIGKLFHPIMKVLSSPNSWLHERGSNPGLLLLHANHEPPDNRAIILLKSILSINP